MDELAAAEACTGAGREKNTADSCCRHEAGL
jgi:hypothetical protein